MRSKLVSRRILTIWILIIMIHRNREFIPVH